MIAPFVMRARHFISLMIGLTFSSVASAQDHTAWYANYLRQQSSDGELVIVEFAPESHEAPARRPGEEPLHSTFESGDHKLGVVTATELDPRFFGAGRTSIREVLEVVVKPGDIAPLIRRAAGVFKVVDGSLQRIAIARTDDGNLETVNDLTYELPLSRWGARPSGLSAWVSQHAGRTSRMGANLLKVPDYLRDSTLFSPQIARPIIVSDFHPQRDGDFATATIVVLDRQYSDRGQLSQVGAHIIRTNFETDGEVPRSELAQPESVATRTFVNHVGLSRIRGNGFSFPTKFCGNAAHDLAAREVAARK